MKQKARSSSTYRLPLPLLAALRKEASLRGVSQNELLVQILEKALWGDEQHVADKHVLATVMWIQEYLWASSKREQSDLKRLWDDMVARAELFFVDSSG